MTRFCARVRRLREEKSWTAEQMAIALGIPLERYRSMKSAAPFPLANSPPCHNH